MRTALGLAAIFAASVAFSSSSDPALTPGIKAPALKVDRWVKGSAPAANHFRVVEFWATWCGPCKVSIPHITELAKKFAGKVDFVGVSVYERTNTFEEIDPLVRGFVTQMGDKMGYNVATDAADKSMAKNWMEAADQHGIPTAFIVDPSGTIMWIGHPMELDAPLEKALAGTLDIAAEREKVLSASRKAAAAKLATTNLRKASTLFAQGKKAEAEAIFDDLVSQGMTTQVESARLNAYVTSKDPKLAALVDKMLNGSPAEQSILVQSAYRTSTTNGDKEWAKGVAKSVADHATDPVALYFAAMTQSNVGESAAALATFEKTLGALDKLNDPRYAQFKKSVEKARDAEKSKKN